MAAKIHDGVDVADAKPRLLDAAGNAAAGVQAGREEAVMALRALTLAGEQFRQAVANHFQIGVSDTLAMTHLSILGPLSAHELAEHVALTPSAVTALLDRLEHAGLAIRTPHPTDRRKTVATISPLGHAALATVQGWMYAAVTTLDDRGLMAATDILTDLAAALTGLTGRRLKDTAATDLVAAVKAAHRANGPPRMNRASY